MLAVPPLVAAAGVNVAVRVRPVPLRGPRVPPETVTSPKVNVAPGSSLKAKVMSAVSPILSVDTLLLIPNVGAVVSMVTGKPADAALTLPAVSVALAVTVRVPCDRGLVVIDQAPPVAMPVPSTVVPSVSYNLTVEPASAVPVKVGVVSLVMLSVPDTPVSLAEAKSGPLGAAGAVLSMV